MAQLFSMGFAQPEWITGCFKRKFRWKFIIPFISADGIFSLPPSKASRPSLTFKTMEAQHLNETIYYPAKPEWKPIQLSLYDMLKYDGLTGLPLVNPIFNWIQRAYDPTTTLCGTWFPSLGDWGNPYADPPIPSSGTMPSIKAAYAFLDLYDGCGGLIERWVFEHVWPESVDFGDLDYAQNEIVMCDVTLRYDRAYLDTQWGALNNVTPFPTQLTDICPFIPPTDITVPVPPYCVNAESNQNFVQMEKKPEPPQTPKPRQQRFMVKK